jgi:hypothetical protein
MREPILNPLELVCQPNFDWAFNNQHLLDDLLAVANEPVRRKGWSNPISPIAEVRIRGARAAVSLRRLVRRTFPIQDHEAEWCAKLARFAAIKHEDLYWTKVRTEFQKIHGRAYQISDYRISGVCREEFDSGTKDFLRFTIHKMQDLRTLADLILLIPICKKGRLPK